MRLRTKHAMARSLRGRRGAATSLAGAAAAAGSREPAPPPPPSIARTPLADATSPALDEADAAVLRAHRAAFAAGGGAAGLAARALWHDDLVEALRRRGDVVVVVRGGGIGGPIASGALGPEDARSVIGAAGLPDADIVSVPSVSALVSAVSDAGPGAVVVSGSAATLAVAAPLLAGASAASCYLASWARRETSWKEHGAVEAGAGAPVQAVSRAELVGRIVAGGGR